MEPGKSYPLFSVSLPAGFPPNCGSEECLCALNDADCLAVPAQENDFQKQLLQKTETETLSLAALSRSQFSPCGSGAMERLRKQQ